MEGVSGHPVGVTRTGTTHGTPHLPRQRAELATQTGAPSGTKTVQPKSQRPRSDSHLYSLRFRSLGTRFHTWKTQESTSSLRSLLGREAGNLDTAGGRTHRGPWRTRRDLDKRRSGAPERTGDVRSAHDGLLRGNRKSRVSRAGGGPQTSRCPESTTVWVGRVWVQRLCGRRVSPPQVRFQRRCHVSSSRPFLG